MESKPTTIVTGAASGTGRAIAARPEQDHAGRTFTGVALPMDLGWSAR